MLLLIKKESANLITVTLNEKADLDLAVNWLFRFIREQTNKDYFIHPKWKDWQVRSFRRIVREQNICIRMGFKKYSKELEHQGRIRKSDVKSMTPQINFSKIEFHGL